jgi:hypothetical protein
MLGDVDFAMIFVVVVVVLVIVERFRFPTTHTSRTAPSRSAATLGRAPVGRSRPRRTWCFNDFVLVLQIVVVARSSHGLDRRRSCFTIACAAASTTATTAPATWASFFIRSGFAGSSRAEILFVVVTGYFRQVLCDELWFVAINRLIIVILACAASGRGLGCLNAWLAATATATAATTPTFLLGCTITARAIFFATAAARLWTRCVPA